MVSFKRIIKYFLKCLFMWVNSNIFLFIFKINNRFLEVRIYLFLLVLVIVGISIFRINNRFLKIKIYLFLLVLVYVREMGRVGLNISIVFVERLFLWLGELFVEK